MDISRFNGLRSRLVSVHSYSRCWIHLIWGTLSRERRSALLALRAASLQPLQSEAGDLARVLQVEFVFDVRSVGLHGLWAEIQ